MRLNEKAKLGIGLAAAFVAAGICMISGKVKKKVYNEEEGLKFTKNFDAEDESIYEVNNKYKAYEKYGIKYDAENNELSFNDEKVKSFKDDVLGIYEVFDEGECYCVASYNEGILSGVDVFKKVN